MIDPLLADLSMEFSQVIPQCTILVVDDEPTIRELLSYNLAKGGYQVECVETGEEALQSARASAPDLILLDLMLPGLNGLDCTRVLKNDPTTREIPIIMLTAKGADSDVIAGLEIGADDYITKPFNARVLLARIKTVLRRKEVALTPSDSDLFIRELTISPKRYAVRVGDDPVTLTATEFAILHFLCKRPGWVFTRQQIINAVRGTDYTVTDRSVDVQIAGLRKKLGPAGRLVQTVRGVGYRIED